MALRKPASPPKPRSKPANTPILSDTSASDEEEEEGWTDSDEDEDVTAGARIPSPQSRRDKRGWRKRALPVDRGIKTTSKGLARRGEPSNRTYTCPRCYTNCYSKVALANHEVVCLNEAVQRIQMPRKGETKQFSAHHKSIPLHICGALDFEAAVKTPKDKASTARTLIDHQFEPVSFSLVFVDENGRVLYEKFAAADSGLMAPQLEPFWFIRVAAASI